MNTTSALTAASFKTLTVRHEGAVLLVEISVPPMNLLGPELVRDLVSLIQQAEADSALRVLLFKSADPEHEAQSQIQAALKRGFQTRDPEMNLAHMLGEL
jgi:enoyl-CoA hydratase/carnithine racemase